MARGFRGLFGRRDEGDDQETARPAGKDAARGSSKAKIRVSSREGARALETLGAVLRSLGRHSFDLEEETSPQRRAIFDAWAKHVVLRKAAPGDDRVEGGEAVERNWAGVRHFVSQQRQAEKAFVNQSTGNLRTALWAVVQGLGWAVIEHQATDDHLRREMQAFLSKVRESPPEEIVAEVRVLVDDLQQIIATRQERQRSHLNQLGDQMRAMRAELASARRDMETDPLTRMFNRGAFDAQLERVAALSTLSGDSCCLAMLDIDHFKKVNDRYGHPGGDEVLRQLGRCLAVTMPRRTDFIARYGGEEFAVIFERDTLSELRPLMTRLMDAVRNLRVEFEDDVIQITVSIGLAELRPRESHDDWLKRADAALYRAKEGGRDRVEESPTEDDP